MTKISKDIYVTCPSVMWCDALWEVLKGEKVEELIGTEVIDVLHVNKQPHW